MIFFEQELRHADFVDGHGVRLLPLVQDVLGAVAKAADGERTDLRVQRKLLQVHWTVGPNGQTLESKRNENFLVHFSACQKQFYAKNTSYFCHQLTVVHQFLFQPIVASFSFLFKFSQQAAGIRTRDKNRPG